MCVFKTVHVGVDHNISYMTIQFFDIVQIGQYFLHDLK